MEMVLSTTFILPTPCLSLRELMLHKNILKQNISDNDRGHFLEYLLDRPDVQKAWRAHTEHKFVAGLADGSLPLENFKFYLVQDYLYLVRNKPLQRNFWT